MPLKIGKKIFAIGFKRKVSRSYFGTFILFIFVGIFAVFTAIPLVFAIVNSLKPLDELWLFPPRLYVSNPTLKNFKDLFILMSNSWVPFSRYIFNTLFITTVGTAGNIIFASMCAYPIAKDNYPGKKTFFKIVVLALMFNATVLTIPSYIIMTKIGFVNTYFSLIIPPFGSAMGLYLMKQFMEGIHDSIIEAAKIDGASHYRIFWIIVMPAVKPAWLTLIIFSVQSLWNIGTTPYIYNETLKTLPYALSQVAAGGIARAGVSAAIAVIMLSVPLTIFVFTQNNIIETMTTSGMKD